MSHRSRITAIAAVTALFVASAWAGEAEDRQAIAEQIKGVWGRIAARDFADLGFSPKGVVHAGSEGGLWREMTGKEMAAFLEAAPTLRATPYHINVRFLGANRDVAYATYYLVGTVSRGEGGEAVSYRTRACSVMEKIDGKWVHSGQHYSPLFGGSGFVTSK